MQRKWRQEMLNEVEKELQRVSYDALMEVRCNAAEQRKRQREQVPETPPAK